MDQKQLQISEYISPAPISRIIKKAGAIRQSGNLAETTRRILCDYFLKQFIFQLCIIARHEGRKTLTLADIEVSCILQNRPLLLSLNPTNPSRTKGLQHENQKRIQNKKKAHELGLKYIDNLELPVSNFSSLIKEIASKEIENVHLKDGVSRLIQYISENWIESVIKGSIWAAEHRKAQTVTDEDIYLVLLMKGIIEPEEWAKLKDNKADFQPQQVEMKNEF